MAKIVPCSDPNATPKWVIVRRLKLVTENYTPSYIDTMKAQEFMAESDDEEAHQYTYDSTQMMEEDEEEYVDVDEYDEFPQVNQDDQEEVHDDYQEDTENRKDDQMKDSNAGGIPGLPERSEHDRTALGNHDDVKPNVVMRQNERYNLRRNPTKKRFDDYILGSDCE